MNRVALVLGAGGARGYAHIGVIQELESRGYQIGCIAGCSMGAVVGGIYAAGKLDEYRQWIESLDYLDVLRLLDVSFKLGAIRGEKIFGRIREIVGEIDIRNLSIPYTAVATDLLSQQEIWFQEGCLHHAMRASAAIPSIFTPVRQGNRVLVDGGVLNPLPIVPVVASHCDLIVAVNLNSGQKSNYRLPTVDRPAPLKQRMEQIKQSMAQHFSSFRKRTESKDSEGRDAEESVERTGNENSTISLPVVTPVSTWEVIAQSIEIMQTSLSQYKIAGYPPDILIDVPRRLCRFFDFHRAQELILVGRQIARDALNQYEQQQVSPPGK